MQLDKKAKIINGKCSNCKNRIVRPFRENPGMVYYAVNLLRNGKKTVGVCEKCRAEIELPMNLLTIKFVINKIHAHPEHKNELVE